jgi:enamine deaminase RidA (YjgF/YER057c/UK114 family)
MQVEERLRKLGIELPPSPTPAANYVTAVRTGNLLFLSGHGPRRTASGPSIKGRVGKELTVEQGYKAAREVGLNLVSTMKASLGDLDKVKRVVKVLGMVNAAPDFEQHPQVMNGFSDLMVEVFGDKGRHARSAVGMGSLPMGIPVEIEVVVEVE